MWLLIGASIFILVWLNMSRREGFQDAPVNQAQPVPMDTISAQKKQDFATAVIQLYHSIIIASPPPMAVQNVPAAPEGMPPPAPEMMPPPAPLPEAGIMPPPPPPPAPMSQ